MGEGKKTGRGLRTIRDSLVQYRVTSRQGFDLDRFAPDDLPGEMPSKGDAKTLLEAGVARLAALQELLYANASWSLLIILQAMDAAGKDSTIAHVMSGVNPQGVLVTPFKAPGAHELAHDFLWRVHRVLPARGMIGIFNRSHYEDVLVARVHADILAKQHLPPTLVGRDLFDERIADIAAFEAYLGRQGTKVLKFFLNVSREAQKARFLARLTEPEKTWKFDSGDLRERAFWPQYRTAYAAAIAGTATEAAPWFVVPADRKWYMRLLVVEAILEALEACNLEAPEVAETERDAMEAARRVLEAED